MFFETCCQPQEFAGLARYTGETDRTESGARTQSPRRLMSIPTNRVCPTCEIPVDPVTGACPRCARPIPAIPAAVDAPIPARSSPSSGAGSGLRTWIIGAQADCDLVIAQPTVSGRHCRLTQTADGFVVEDMQSRNGTFVNGAPITSPINVTRSDRVTLGQSIPMPWPDEASGFTGEVFRIGRAPDNDVVLDYPGVSAHHARIYRSGDQTWIEDLGSTNGTALGSPEGKITRTVLTEDSVVYFGSLRVPARRLLAASPTIGEHAVSATMISGRATVL